ncbi:MAG: 50S ribosomal protein L22 [Thermoleophilaceae bacterium]|nr:50S ribosomal protein L22 [Thermoleophilaceae bacterium]
MVRATARYVHSSPRKARLVVDNIRGKSVPQARVTLNFMQRHVARDVAKVLESAVANAEHNHELDGDDLHVAHVFVDQGPTLKRFRPRARGVASPIMKRTSHITVVVSPTSAKELARKKATA